MNPYFAFQWHITDNCDQRCRHCYIFSEDSCKKLAEMSYSDMEKVLDNCLDMCGILSLTPYFYITGGDPILHPDFWRLLELLKKHEITFAILGNPFHLNDEVCRRLYDYGCRKYQLSLDGLGNPRQLPQARLLRHYPGKNQLHPQGGNVLCHHVHRI